MTVWSLGQRTGLSRTAIQAALSGPQVVRTHTLRPTWHLVVAEDLPKAQAATAERVRRQLGSFTRSLGLDGPTLARFTDWLVATLAEGPRTRAALREAAELAGFAFDGMTMGIAMLHAELDLVVCDGPPEGRAQTYRLLAGTVDPDRPAAVRWLVEAFLRSHGPSSVRDVCAWSSLTVTDVRAALADLGHLVDRESVLDEERYWIGPLARAGWESPTAALINGYDEYVSGLSARSKAHLDPGNLATARPLAPIALVMVEGLVAGNWRRTLGRTAILEVHLLRDLDRDEEDSLSGAAQRYADFVGLPLELDLRRP